MKIGGVDISERVLVIAEIGNNHEGDFAVAQEMVTKAAKAGADAVKFQTFKTEHYISPANPERVSMLKSFELTPHEFALLERTARDEGLLFISTPFDLLSVDVLTPLVDVFKVSSGDNTFYPLLEKIARQGKSVVLSTGLAQIPQVRYAKTLMERIWAEDGCQAELAILHCVTSYPVPMREANLRMIRVLAEQCGGAVGYSDHTLGIEAAVASVACGARIVEKHFTLDKQHSSFRDHQLSADPAEFKTMVEKIRALEAMFGSGRDELMACEVPNKDMVRRSIAAAGDLKPGQILTMRDLTWLRPAGGLAPGRETLLLGRRLKEAVAAGTALSLDMVEPEEA